jgi:hypothetical protein
LGLGGCAFFNIDRDVVPRLANTPIKWTVLDAIAERDGLYSPGFEELNASVGNDFTYFSRTATESTKPAEWGDPIIRFLHISDAQIRDERIHEAIKDRWQLKLADKAIGVSKRNPYVDSYDTLTFAAFVLAGKKKIKAEEHGYIVFTGDLLDISTSSELIEAMNVLRSVEKYYPDNYYAVAGNHDGLIFGNVSDYLSFTWNLGISRTEFVLGHLTAGRDFDRPQPYGFGFEANEIIVNHERILQNIGTRREIWDAAGSNDASTDLAKYISLRRMDYVRWQCDDIRSVLRTPGAPKYTPNFQTKYEANLNEKLSPPIQIPGAYRQSIRIREKSEIGLQTGYYSWLEDIDGPVGITKARNIVLDTRSHLLASAAVDCPQLLWLYNEMCSANANREIVLIFAHHSPDSFFVEHQNKWALRQIIGAFPNVVAYFYGHSHWNDVKKLPASSGELPLIQTGSMTDFPQMGRWIKIFAKPGESNETVECRISWDFVRPSFENNPGTPLNMMLDASRIDSRREQKEDVGWHYALNLPHHLFPNGCPCDKDDWPLDWEGFTYRCLQSDSLDTSIRFLNDVPDAQPLMGEQIYREALAWREWLGLP